MFGYIVLANIFFAFTAALAAPTAGMPLTVTAESMVGEAALVARHPATKPECLDCPARVHSNCDNAEGSWPGDTGDDQVVFMPRTALLIGSLGATMFIAAAEMPILMSI
mmetsp:Transcript_726/g.1737  ORF Transcript_726/g.1737 Transcript_726/m.1737 type:complete len:109 (+) Transcript_726:69-395(+)|eukprot:CAMPEP_0170626730 /NCGR_PEP_ID=MMETSP0224-20130122/31529_1 /TAXON_ID=285029 /ORGANISM="Togula jolla, Strain CCCM 725" /LENGTH=108 /DNA_ID=CAMNT_0010953553 /DNA_START=69 /DNA_END=395 /DNA_ORIENTATION=+